MLAREQDPRARALGITAAAYFLGRVDRAAEGYDVSAPMGDVPDAERAILVARCSDLLSEEGIDLRAQPGDPAGATL